MWHVTVDRTASLAVSVSKYGRHFFDYLTGFAITEASYMGSNRESRIDGTVFFTELALFIIQSGNFGG